MRELVVYLILLRHFPQNMHFHVNSTGCAIRTAGA